MCAGAISDDTSTEALQSTVPVIGTPADDDPDQHEVLLDTYMQQIVKLQFCCELTDKQPFACATSQCL